MKQKALTLLVALFAVTVVGSIMGCGEKRTDEEQRTIDNAGTISSPAPGAANQKSGPAPPPP